MSEPRKLVSRSWCVRTDVEAAVPGVRDAMLDLIPDGAEAGVFYDDMMLTVVWDAALMTDLFVEQLEALCQGHGFDSWATISFEMRVWGMKEHRHFISMLIAEQVGQFADYDATQQSR